MCFKTAVNNTTSKDNTGDASGAIGTRHSVWHRRHRSRLRKCLIFLLNIYFHTFLTKKLLEIQAIGKSLSNYPDP